MNKKFYALVNGDIGKIKKNQLCILSSDKEKIHTKHFVYRRMSQNDQLYVKSFDTFEEVCDYFGFNTIESDNVERSLSEDDEYITSV